MHFSQPNIWRRVNAHLILFSDLNPNYSYNLGQLLRVAFYVKNKKRRKSQSMQHINTDLWLRILGRHLCKKKNQKGAEVKVTVEAEVSQKPLDQWREMHQMSTARREVESLTSCWADSWKRRGGKRGIAAELVLFNLNRRGYNSIRKLISVILSELGWTLHQTGGNRPTGGSPSCRKKPSKKTAN